MAKILLIDSDRSSRQVLEHALKLYEYDVITTNRGDEGMALAVAESPNLIVMDIDAVGLNGWQAIKILKQSRLTWLIPVIAMAAPDITGQLLLQTGFDTYIRKPAAARHVVRRIDTLLDQVQNELAPELTDAQRYLGHTTVVYVDDNPLNNQTMAGIVEGAGYSYGNISDPLQALSQLINLRPQLIFLSLVLPVTNGYELCAQIRRLAYFQYTPIIIVTSPNRINERVRAKMAGASECLSRPLSTQSVLRVLVKYLSPSSMM